MNRMVDEFLEIRNFLKSPKINIDSLSVCLLTTNQGIVNLMIFQFFVMFQLRRRTYDCSDVFMINVQHCRQLVEQNSGHDIMVSHIRIVGHEQDSGQSLYNRFQWEFCEELHVEANSVRVVVGAKDHFKVETKSSGECLLSDMICVYWLLRHVFILSGDQLHDWISNLPRLAVGFILLLSPDLIHHLTIHLLLLVDDVSQADEVLVTLPHVEVIPLHLVWILVVPGDIKTGVPLGRPVLTLLLAQVSNVLNIDGFQIIGVVLPGVVTHRLGKTLGGKIIKRFVIIIPVCVTTFIST